MPRVGSASRAEYESDEEELVAQGGELWFLQRDCEDTAAVGPPPGLPPSAASEESKVAQYDEYGDPLEDDEDGPSKADATAAMAAIAHAKAAGAAFEAASGESAEAARETLRKKMRSQGLAAGSAESGGIDPKRFQDAEDEVGARPAPLVETSFVCVCFFFKPMHCIMNVDLPVTHSSTRIHRFRSFWLFRCSAHCSSSKWAATHGFCLKNP